MLIWDVVFPKKADAQKTWILPPLQVALPNKTVNTGYGVRFLDTEQGPAHFLDLAEKVGFRVIDRISAKGWFFLELGK